MKHKYLIILAALGTFIGETAFSQDISRFSSDKNKFSVGFELSGAFPLGSFSNANISFPCNSTVSAASAFELTLGYKINSNFGGMVALSEGLYSLDPSSSGVSQLLNDHPGLYQSATVSKSGQLISQSVMVGGFYDLPLSKMGNIFLKGRAMVGLIGCRIPEIEVQGYHTPGVADNNGNSIDTIETWDTPKIYAYTVSWRLDAGVYYTLNKNLEFFVNLHYQGASLSYPNVPATYKLSVNSNNAGAGTSVNLVNYNHLTTVNPSVLYQILSLGLGCEVRF